MKHNKDNRKDNVENIQRNINSTIRNIHRADEMIEKTPDKKMKETLEDKNERRQHALAGMRREIKDEANYRDRHRD